MEEKYRKRRIGKGQHAATKSVGCMPARQPTSKAIIGRIRQLRNITFVCKHPPKIVEIVDDEPKLDNLKDIQRRFMELRKQQRS